MFNINKKNPGKNKIKTAIFIGRFQPFHNAHLKVINDILKENDGIIIGIGSSQESRTKENPFSFEERKEMIEDTLKANKIKNYKIFGIPDFFDDEKWVGYIKNNIKFDIVYSGNPITIKCFDNKGFKTRKINLIKGVNSTDIRNKIAKSEKWEYLVPEGIAAYIKKIKGIERIKK